MANSPIFHVRADDTLIAKIDELAAVHGTNRSVMVRSLISAALGEPAQTAVARETLMLLSEQRKVILARFSGAMQEIIAEIASDARNDIQDAG